MSKELVVSANHHETKLAILENDELVEIYIERGATYGVAGSIYKGRVSRVLPGMQSAFVKVGLERDAFLYVSDVIDAAAEAERFDSDGTGEATDQYLDAGQPARVAARPVAQASDPSPSTDSQDSDSRGGDRDRRGGRRGRRRRGRGPRSDEAPRGESDQRSAQTETPRRRDDSRSSDPRRDRPERSERSDRTERSDQPQRSDRPESADRTDRTERSDRPERTDRTERTDRPERSDRSRRGGDRFEPRGDHRRDDVKTAAPRETFPDDEDDGDSIMVLPGESLAKYQSRPEGRPARVEEKVEPRRNREEEDVEPSWSRRDRDFDQDEKRAGTNLDTEDEEENDLEEFADTPDDQNDYHKSLDDDDEPEAEQPRPEAEAPQAETPKAEAVETVAVVEAVEEPPIEAQPETTPTPAPTPAPQTSSQTDEDSGDRSLFSWMRLRRHRDRSGQTPDPAPKPAVADAPPSQPQETADPAPHTEEPESVQPVEHSTPGRPEAHVPALDEERHAEPGMPVPDPEQSDSDSDSEQGRAERAEVRERSDDPRYLRRRGRRGRRRGGRGRYPSDRPEETTATAAVPERRVETPAEAPVEHSDGHARISDLLKPGQEIIVQIAKEPLGKKGARITTHVALPGRYLVYMPTVAHAGVSRKISTDAERQRLRKIVQTHRTGMPGGFIVRTAGQGASEEEVRGDMLFLYNLWLDICAKGEGRPAPALLHQDLNIVQRILRDQLGDEYKTIWVDNEEEYESVLRFVERFQPSLINRVKLYNRSTPIFEEFNIDDELEKALRPKVWLKSGGYIVINQTEALVAIDVNTGKFVGKSDRLEDTIVKTNLEAVQEIVRQMRLRDLGGIIVVDFIDMDDRKNRHKVMQALEQELAIDRAPSKALSFNDFGLIAITRKRVKQSLERAICSPCPYCTGAGSVKSIPTVIYEILAEARKMSPKMRSQKDVTIRCSPDVGRELKSRDNAYLQELEDVLRANVGVRSDVSLHREHFDIN